MDCFVVSLLAMTKNGAVIARVALQPVAILIWRPPYPIKTRHCENRGFVAISVCGTVAQLTIVIARVCRTCGNLVILGLSLRGFEKAVAISFILDSSLRRPKACGNPIYILHNYNSLLFVIEKLI